MRPVRNVLQNINLVLFIKMDKIVQTCVIVINSAVLILSIQQNTTVHRVPATCVIDDA